MSSQYVPAPEANRPSTPFKLRNRALWLLQILAALFFVAAAISKFTGAEYNVMVFEKVGLGQWFRYFTGVLEVTGALLLLRPRSAALGGLLLAVVMVGALFTDLVILKGNGIAALVALVITAAIAWLRRPEWIAHRRRPRR